MDNCPRCGIDVEIKMIGEISRSTLNVEFLRFLYVIRCKNCQHVFVTGTEGVEKTLMSVTKKGGGKYEP